MQIDEAVNAIGRQEHGTKCMFENCGRVDTPKTPHGRRGCGEAAGRCCCNCGENSEYQRALEVTMFKEFAGNADSAGVCLWYYGVAAPIENRVHES